MHRSAVILPALALGLAAMMSAPARASSPSSGTLSYSNPSLTWASSTPMTGSAPEERRVTCNAPSTCDDFALTLDRGGDAQALLELSLTPSSGASMGILVYAPGCAVTVTNNCYQLYGTDARLLGAVNGQYTIRIACSQCTGASYSMRATLRHFTASSLPGAGDQRFRWTSQQLPGDPASTAYGEPGISVNKLGHVIVNTFGPTVWVSHDDGATFSGPTVVDPVCGQGSGDADSVVAFDDTYYVDNLCIAGGTNLSYTSRDGGATWNSSKSHIPSGGGTDSDRQWYAADPVHPGTIYFSYHDLSGPNIWLLKSTDYGDTFTQATPITLMASNYVDTSQGNTTARPLVDPTNPNVVSILYASNTAQKSATASPTSTDFDLTEIYMAQSTDGGKTFANYLVLPPGSNDGQDNTVAHEFPQSTVDSAGNIYVLFAQRLGNSTQTHIEMGVIPHGSTTMRGPFRVDQNGLGANVFVWAAAGDPGMVDISWYGSLARDNNDTTASWSEMFAQTTNALSDHPRFTQSRVSGTLPSHMADICLAGTLCAATGGNRNLADFQGIDADPCGYAELVWTDDHSGSSVTMVARQAAGTTIRPSAAASCRRSAHAADGGVHAASTPGMAGAGTATAPGVPSVHAPLSRGTAAAPAVHDAVLTAAGGTRGTAFAVLPVLLGAWGVARRVRRRRLGSG